LVCTICCWFGFSVVWLTRLWHRAVILFPKGNHDKTSIALYFKNMDNVPDYPMRHAAIVFTVRSTVAGKDRTRGSSSCLVFSFFLVASGI
jgi:hypothetical protein